MMFSFSSVFFMFVIASAIGSQLSNVASSYQNVSRSELYRLRRQIDCDGFSCQTSGECISEDKYCDGNVDCKDESDETTRCKSLRCPNYLFRCKYGACISKTLECNGRKDCKDGSDETTANCKKNQLSTCRSNQFQCTSGQCIPEDNKCDGTPDCTDQSDETTATCAHIPCPRYTFRCAYGACIKRTGRCNGISECFDNSDEDPTLCGTSGVTTRPVTSRPPVTPTPTRKPIDGQRPPVITSAGSCVLPPKIENGNWQVLLQSEGSTYNYAPGDKVSSGTILDVKCRGGFKVDNAPGSNVFLVCYMGTWAPRVPQCIQTCPPLKSTATTLVTCKRGSADVNCSEAISGTTAIYKCPHFYELGSNINVLYCLDGSWDEAQPVCRPVCGEKNVKVKELIIGGQKVKRGSYPWTIAIYEKIGDYFTHICGGSLINQRVIVTAAHCVANREGKKKNEALYRVAAGKYYLFYNDSRDTDAEFSEVESINVHTNYKGSILDYEGDLAVIVTKEAFNTTQFIQRVCVDWEQNSNYESRLIGAEGIVTGWGYTVRGANQSEVLKEISLPYIDYSSCWTAMPSDYKKYVRSDKMCAGFLDKGVGVCEGDSGGGLVFIDHLHDSRFYLRGIVSIAPQVSGSCNEDEYAIYTKLSSYIDFVHNIERRYRS